MPKEFRFFVYLMESYAQHRGTTPGSVLAVLDERGLTNFVYDMYEAYHSEAMENAFADIDSLIEKGTTAW